MDPVICGPRTRQSFLLRELADRWIGRPFSRIRMCEILSCGFKVELPRLVVHLRLPKSRFVDDGLNHKVVSIEKVHALYCWGVCGTTKRARYFALARMLFEWRIFAGSLVLRVPLAPFCNLAVFGPPASVRVRFRSLSDRDLLGIYHPETRAYLCASPNLDADRWAVSRGQSQVFSRQRICCSPSSYTSCWVEL
jgi:hypothetical protein